MQVCDLHDLFRPVLYLASFHKENKGRAGAGCLRPRGAQHTPLEARNNEHYGHLQASSALSVHLDSILKVLFFPTVFRLNGIFRSFKESGDTGVSFNH